MQQPKRVQHRYCKTTCQDNLKCFHSAKKKKREVLPILVHLTFRQRITVKITVQASRQRALSSVSSSYCHDTTKKLGEFNHGRMLGGTSLQQLVPQLRCLCLLTSVQIACKGSLCSSCSCDKSSMTVRWRRLVVKLATAERLSSSVQESIVWTVFINY